MWWLSHHLNGDTSRIQTSARHGDTLFTSELLNQIRVILRTEGSVPLYKQLRQLSEGNNELRLPLTVEMSDSDIDAVDVNIPVTFTYGSTIKTFNRQPDGSGGEGVGVWRENDVAWKLYSTRQKLQAIMEDYRIAENHGLPMGTNPKPTFIEGTVQQGQGAAITSGFALVTRWSDGTEFNFHRTGGRPFRLALRDEEISHSRSSTQYLRILGGCQSASLVGLTDAQGKVNGEANVYEPIVFFDVHTSTPPSTHAEQLVQVITEWGTDP